MSLDPKRIESQRKHRRQLYGADIERLISTRGTIRIWTFKNIKDIPTVRSSDEIDTPMKTDWKKDSRRLIQGWRLGGTTPVLTKMSPDVFLSLSPIKSTHISERSLESIRRGLSEGVVFDTPFILIDTHGEVKGHEGRHRALVLKEISAKEMPVLVAMDYSL